MQSWYQQIHKRCLLAEYRMSRKTVVYLVWSNTYVYSKYSIGIGKITQTASTQDLYIYIIYQGFNYIWQDDSYDKIKNCGICINNCIDGYSLKKLLGPKLLIQEAFFISHCYRIFYHLRNTKSTFPKQLSAAVEQRIRIFVFNIA